MKDCFLSLIKLIRVNFFPAYFILSCRTFWTTLTLARFWQTRAFLNFVCLFSYLLSAFFFLLNIISGSLGLSFSLLALLLPFNTPAQLYLLLLVSVQVFIFIKCMFTQIPHINVNFCRVWSHVLINFPYKCLVSGCKVRILLADNSFMCLKFLRHVVHQLLEVFLVVQNELWDYGFVYLRRWELILSVFYNDSCELGEVLWYLWSAVLHNH